jgi:aminopeptidase N
MVVMNFPTGGEEYPGLVFVHNQGDAAYRRFITAHETGHQWFYGIAGNDTLRHAWLDESLVQIGGFLYWKRTQSPAVAEEFWLRILRWYNRRQSPLKKIDTPLADFRDFEDYMSTTYGEGAVFLRNLSEKMGDNAFLAGLRTYVQAVNLGIGTPVQFFNSMQAQTTIDLKPLFCQRAGIMC